MTKKSSHYSSSFSQVRGWTTEFVLLWSWNDLQAKLQLKSLVSSGEFRSRVTEMVTASCSCFTHAYKQLFCCCTALWKILLYEFYTYCCYYGLTWCCPGCCCCLVSSCFHATVVILSWCYLSIYLSIYLSVCLSVCLSVYGIWLVHFILFVKHFVTML